MIGKWWLLLSGCVVCATAVAVAPDDDERNDGTWNVRIEGDAHTARQARVVIQEFAGNWRELGPKRAGDTCRGQKPFPITVQRTNETDVEFSVWSETVTKECPDFALTLKVVDERTLVGTLKAVDERKAASMASEGREVRLTRVPDKKKTQR